MKLSVIIPAYNEEKRLKKTLDSVCRYLTGQNYESEVIVVDDGSVDSTVTTAKTWPQVKILKHQYNQGKGAAVRTGMMAATGDYRLFMDADNSTTIDHLPPFLNAAINADVVIASRRLPQSKITTPQPWHREFLGACFRFLVRMLVTLEVSDSQAGFKLFSARAAEEVFKKQTIDRWAFDVEIIVIAKRLGLIVRELPIVWQNDRDSKVRLRGMLNMLREVLVVRRNIKRGVYNF